MFESRTQLRQELNRLATERDGLRRELTITTQERDDAVTAMNELSRHSHLRDIDIRLAVLKDSGWSDLKAIDERSRWVFSGALPVEASLPTKPDVTDGEALASLAEGPQPPMIRPDEVNDVLISLEQVLEKLRKVYEDPNLSIGRVRIQHAAGTLGYAVADLRRIIEEAGR